MKSTFPSREAAYDQDSDELDHAAEELGGGVEEEPLLMEGLIQSGMRRASLDVRRSGAAGEPGGESINKGAGVGAGIANMSNSILGAGIIGLPYVLPPINLLIGRTLLPDSMIIL